MNIPFLIDNNGIAVLPMTSLTIGLAIAKKLTDKHNGFNTARSRVVSRWQFNIVLPLVQKRNEGKKVIVLKMTRTIASCLPPFLGKEQILKFCPALPTALN